MHACMLACLKDRTLAACSLPALGYLHLKTVHALQVKGAAACGCARRCFFEFFAPPPPPPPATQVVQIVQAATQVVQSNVVTEASPSPPPPPAQVQARCFPCKQPWLL